MRYGSIDRLKDKCDRSQNPSLHPTPPVTYPILIGYRDIFLRRSTIRSMGYRARSAYHPFTSAYRIRLFNPNGTQRIRALAPRNYSFAFSANNRPLHEEQRGIPRDFSHGLCAEPIGMFSHLIFFSYCYKIQERVANDRNPFSTYDS